MAKINNSDLTQALIEGARIHSGSDRTPDDLAKSVVPILDVTPDFHRRITIVKTASRTTTGSATLFTTPSGNQDFYISAVQLSIDHNATADSTAGFLQCVIGGATINLITIVKLTTTACQQTVTLPFPIPIKVDRGTTITVSQTYTVGAGSISAFVAGYLVNTE